MCTVPHNCLGYERFIISRVHVIGSLFDYNGQGTSKLMFFHVQRLQIIKIICRTFVDDIFLIIES